MHHYLNLEDMELKSAAHSKCSYLGMDALTFFILTQIKLQIQSTKYHSCKTWIQVKMDIWTLWMEKKLQFIKCFCTCINQPVPALQSRNDWCWKMMPRKLTLTYETRISLHIIHYKNYIQKYSTVFSQSKRDRKGDERTPQPLQNKHLQNWI
jgi:hypothetical protein